MTLEESRDVIPIMEEMISLIEEQERFLSETSKELEQMEIMDRRIKELEADCQKWYELASKLNSENRLLQKQNVELLKLSGQ
ncbi:MULTISPECIES: hypothetical protein [Oscillospiraceae]|uniref:hypothetical protein n=1 Tax=Oscillospiraceae TaxID=216572 RepID=UPI001FAA21A0|nr:MULTISPECIES: hypothetical protein [Oscillospiraceae]